MKSRMIPTNKLAVLSAAVCAVVLAFSHNASALTIGDPNQLGAVTYGDGSGDAAARLTQVNYLIDLAAWQGNDFVDGQHYNRSSNDFGSLPAAVLAGAVTGGGGSIDLGAFGGGPYTYLYVNYPNYTSSVWYIGNLSGVITIPTNPQGFPLGLWTLFASGGGSSVPEGGATAMLLGGALGALVLARRFLMS